MSLIQSQQQDSNYNLEQFKLHFKRFINNKNFVCFYVYPLPLIRKYVILLFVCFIQFSFIITVIPVRTVIHLYFLYANITKISTVVLKDDIFKHRKVTQVLHKYLIKVWEISAQTKNFFQKKISFSRIDSLYKHEFYLMQRAFYNVRVNLPVFLFVRISLSLQSLFD